MTTLAEALGGWHYSNVLAHDTAQDFADAFIACGDADDLDGDPTLEQVEKACIAHYADVSQDHDPVSIADAPGYASQVWGGWVWVVGSDELRYSKRRTRGECVEAVREAYRRCGMDAFNPED